MLYIVAVSVGYFLLQLPVVKNLEYRGYDFLASLSVKPLKESPVVVVGIDEMAMQQIPTQWPWPRSLHAKVLENLQKEGAKAVVFDIIFSQASEAKEDRAFSHAIKESQSVILASDHYTITTDRYTQSFDIRPLERFVQSGAIAGDAQLPLDGDRVIRRYPLKHKAMWAKTVKISHKELTALKYSQREYIRYYSLASIPYVSYYQVVKEDMLPKGWCKNKIVIIGLNSNITTVDSREDSFATPTFMIEKQLIPGVFIHANIIANYLKNGAIAPLSGYKEIILYLLVTVVFFAMLVQIKRLIFATLYSVIFSLLIVVVAYFLFTMQIWLHFVALLLYLLWLYVIYVAYRYIKTYREKAYIKMAFKRYLSPEMVERIAQHPEVLELRGERKKITTLFCDLANFTSVSEELAPVELSDMMNEYFSIMTKVLHENGATVDKFIGDAVMAFWGAPLEDEEQENHALHGAYAMLEAFDIFAHHREIFKHNSVRLRIGIYSGEAIVGNFGSKERLSYTAIGDSINTASRLEGANKMTQTSILIGKSTYDALSSELKASLQPQGEVTLKGKSKKVMTYGATLNRDDAKIHKKT